MLGMLPEVLLELFLVVTPPPVLRIDRKTIGLAQILLDYLPLDLTLTNGGFVLAAPENSVVLLTPAVVTPGDTLLGFEVLPTLAVALVGHFGGDDDCGQNTQQRQLPAKNRCKN
jgi:hypothetical protein